MTKRERAKLRQVVDLLMRTEEDGAWDDAMLILSEMAGMHSLHVEVESVSFAERYRLAREARDEEEGRVVDGIRGLWC